MIGLSVTYGHSLGVSSLVNKSLSLFPLSLTACTTHSFGSNWYAIVASEPICQNSRPLPSSLHLVQVSNEFDTVLPWVSWILFLENSRCVSPSLTNNPPVHQME